MVKVKRRQLRAIAERKGPLQGTRLSKPSTSKTDEEQDGNDWVIVKKQRIRIWIPPKSTEKPLLQRSNLKDKRTKPSQVLKESQPRSMAERHLKHLLSEQKKSPHISKNKEKSSKTQGSAPLLRPLDCIIPQSTYEITSKDANPFVGESAPEPSWKHMVRMNKSSKTHVSPMKLRTGVLAGQSTQRLSLLAASCLYEPKKSYTFESISCLNMGELQNQQTRALNLERKLEQAGGLSKWLVSQGLEQFVLIFQRENVDKLQLLNLTMGKLNEMGATAVGPRRKLIHAIDTLPTLLFLIRSTQTSIDGYHHPCISQICQFSLLNWRWMRKSCSSNAQSREEEFHLQPCTIRAKHENAVSISRYIFTCQRCQGLW